MNQNWFNLSIDEVQRKLDTDVDSGLKKEEVSKRQSQYGFNELKAKKKKSLIQKFLEQFKDFMIIVLIIAAIVSGIIGVKEGEGITDTIIIMIVVVVNAIIGVAQENKAEKSLEALQKMSSHVAKVVRNGKLEVVQSRELVPGDVVVLETGDFIPADLRIIEAVNLKSQEASLTGESLPVEKMSNEIDSKKIGIGDRSNMLFSSSLITYGRGKGIVVETGMETEVGKIAEMINETEEKGNYGPYKQSLRGDIYRSYAKYMIEMGKAYPCFCSAEEVDEIRKKQEAAKVRPGYYGVWAKCRNLTVEEMAEKIKAGEKYIIRFKSPGREDRKIKHHDVIKGNVTFPENDQDIVIIKEKLMNMKKIYNK